MINFPKVGLFAYLTEIRFSTHSYLAEIRFPTVSDNILLFCRMKVLKRSQRSDVALAVTQTDREGQTTINHAQHQCVILGKRKTLIFEPLIWATYQNTST